MKKAFEKYRKRADKIIKEVNEAKTPQEYINAIPSPTQIGNPEPLDSIFTRNPDKQKLEEVSEQKREEYQQRKETSKIKTAEEIAQARLQKLRQR